MNSSYPNTLSGVVNMKNLRRNSVPYMLVWIFYYAWVVGFTTWWTAMPGVGSAFHVELRSVIHIINLISSAICILSFKKDWFVFTARIGAVSISIALGLYLIAPSPQVRAFSAALLGASLGCMNVSILIPFTFVLNNTEKLCAVAASHMLSNAIPMLICSQILGKSVDAYLAWFILLFAISMVPLFRRSHLPAIKKDQPAIGKNMRPALAWTVIIGTLGAIFFLGTGKAMLNTYVGSQNFGLLQWYFFGGIAGGILTVFIFAVVKKSIHAVLSIPFGALAIGLSCNAFGGRAIVMETLFGILLGIGTTVGMSTTYYIIGVVGKKYNSMFFLRLSLLIIGICGGIPGVLIGNVLTGADTSFASIFVPVVLSSAVILILIASPYIAHILFDENWAKDITWVDANTAISGIEARFSQLGLTVREREVCVLLLKAYSIKQIAVDLKIAYATANVHCMNLYRKLGISSRAELFQMFGVIAANEENKP